VSGPVKSGANNKYGKNQCQGKDTGNYQGKPGGKFEEKHKETEAKLQKKPLSPDWVTGAATAPGSLLFIRNGRRSDVN
jgi:hypothetical protein